MGLLGSTAADVRDVMVEGESGLLAISPPWNRPKYEPSKRRLTWPNGAIATTYSADEPDRLRGPQHDRLWADEVAAWRYPDAWDMAMLGLRLGNDPRAIVTTTPKRTALMRELLKMQGVARTGGSTYENRANLAGAFVEQIITKYEGTRLGRQELMAEMLDDVEGALWTWGLIEKSRIEQAPPLRRVVVGVDPSATSGDDSDETGIVVAGIGSDGVIYILADRSLRGRPAEWAAAAIRAYHEYEADRVVVEKNNGGEMVEHTIHSLDPTIPTKLVWASRGKLTRAEPISALYEQGKVRHVEAFPALEDQMTTWVPGEDSPDRMDALVWAATELSGGKTFKVLFEA
jgi:phage terminase large subunit-like protein